MMVPGAEDDLSSFFSSSCEAKKKEKKKLACSVSARVVIRAKKEGVTTYSVLPGSRSASPPKEAARPLATARARLAEFAAHAAGRLVRATLASGAGEAALGVLRAFVRLRRGGVARRGRVDLQQLRATIGEERTLIERGIRAYIGPPTRLCLVMLLT
jgi:hypothetical protein